MKLLTRFLLITGVGLTLLLTAFYFSQRSSQLIIGQAVEQHQTNNQKKVAQALEIISRLQVLFVRDYSFWDDMADAVQKKDLEWIASEFYGPLEIYQADAVWVYNQQGELLFADANSLEANLQTLPFSFSELSINTSKEEVSTFFHAGTDNQVLAYHIGPVLHHSIETQAEPFGYIVVAVKLDQEFQQELGSLLQADVKIVQTTTSSGSLTKKDELGLYSISQPLANLQQKQIALVEAHFFDTSLGLLAQLIKKQFLDTGIFLALGVSVALLLFYTFFITPIKQLITKIEKVGFSTKNAKNVYSGSEIQTLSALVDTYAVQMLTANKLSKAVEYATDAIIITDAHGHIEYVNPAWQKLNGYSLEEAIGHKPSILKSDLTKSVVYQQLWQSLIERKSYTTEQVINKRKDGSLYAAQVSVFPVTDKKKITHFVGICQDISERKSREKLKSEFISLASHQLRTPITSIRWFVEILKKTIFKGLKPQEKESFIAIEHSTLRMIALVNRLLNLSRIETGRLSVQSGDIVLHSFLEQLEQELQPALKRKNVTYTWKNTASATTIFSDEDLLHEACINVIANAIKYTNSEGSVALTVTQKEQTIHWKVTDTGIGISKDELPKIFQRFFRAKNAIEADPQGTGLGLYLVKLLVEVLGGKVKISSELAVGTTVEFSIPIQTDTVAGEIGIVRSIVK